MHALLYDGTFEGFLSAVFDAYYYKFQGPQIVKAHAFNGNIFEKVHNVHTDLKHSARVWAGLAKRLSPAGLQQVYKTFLSHLPAMEDMLLRHLQYAFASATSVETNFGHKAVLMVQQTAKKVQREAHRMEAFVRFQQTADNLYYAIIEPDYDVLPLVTRHFQDRYADQRWMIWDSRRHYGIYYDLHFVTVVNVAFEAGTNSGKDISSVQDTTEPLYQQLWQQYVKSVNIPARKNTKLQIQHMPVRYWKYLPEMRGSR